MIEFIEACKTYRAGGRDVVAVQPTTLSVARGEIFGLVGHSGAGKSTLLRMINRLEEPSSGRIIVDGTDITALDAAGLRRFRRRMGMIFQHFNLLSSRTVADNVAMPLQLAGEMSRRQVDERVAALLQRVGLADQAHKYPAQLSGGQKQRVGIARALTTDPAILLCDEPTSALDPQTTGQVLELLEQINRELGLTIVLITHEMDVIRRIGDRVAVMDGGVVVEQGGVADVFLHPQHATTRHFVQESGGDVTVADHAGISGCIVRLTFLGEATYAPLLGKVARATGVDYNVLAGRIGRIRHQPCGQLVLALSGGAQEQALAELRAADVHVEVLRP